ncbi:MAG: 2,4-dihydroxyhept-2-ene-1,7-dioic acid aldolase [Alphaproteobacteria bacterium]|nr:2,4-dihydroxyhept-2-ene-1,7-dioic acid aldolase [Alphaproteobacteria bacterium]
MPHARSRLSVYLSSETWNSPCTRCETSPNWTKGGIYMSRNPLRDCLNAGKPTVGTHILSAWPTLVELIGHSRQYDYVEFTAEYAPFTMHDLDNLGRAFELTGMSGMIKIEQTQYTHQAMRAIGSGFQSVLFADIRSVEDAKAAVDAVRAETTMAEGVRGRGRLGVGMRRDVGTVRTGGTPAYVDALNEVVIAIMVEKKSCVDNLEAVLSVPGIDMVQFGASDFSMSIGKTGQYADAEVLAAEKKTIETALRMGLHPRVELRDPDQAGKYLAMGVKHFCIGWDVRILADWWDTKGAEMRGLLGAKADAPAKVAGKTGNY